MKKIKKAWTVHKVYVCTYVPVNRTWLDPWLYEKSRASNKPPTLLHSSTQLHANGARRGGGLDTDGGASEGDKGLMIERVRETGW